MDIKELIATHGGKILSFAKEPIFWVLIIIAFEGGVKYSDAKNDSLRQELELKAERLNGLEKRYKLEELDSKQILLLKAIYKYQSDLGTNEIVIMKDGNVENAESNACLPGNLIESVSCKESNSESMREFRELVFSVPTRFLHLNPKIGYGDYGSLMASLTSEAVKVINKS